jgi:predicted transcriptional regulator of viral defense system
MSQGEHSLTQLDFVCHPMHSVRRRTPAKRPFSYQEALQRGLSRRTLQRWLKEERIERIERGLYRAVGEEVREDAFRAATALVGEPSAICLLSALSEYNLTDIIPRNTWVMVPAPKRSTSARLRLVRKRTPHWNVGVVRKTGYSITSVERTIVDTMLSVEPGLDEGLAALKKALRQKLTSPARIAETAQKLGVYERLLPYLRALS